MVLVCWFFWSPSAAHAQSESFALDWAAPDGCPRHADIEHAAQELLSTAASETATSVRVRGRIQRRGGRFQLALEVETPSGRAERSLSAADCRALGQTAAWLIALAVDPRSSDRGEPSAREPNEAVGGATATGIDSAAMDDASSGSTRALVNGTEARMVDARGPAREQNLDAPSTEREPDATTSAQEAAHTPAPAPAPAEEKRVERRAPAPPRVRYFRAGGPVPRPPQRWARFGVGMGIWGAKLPGPQLDLVGRAGFGSGALYGEVLAGWAVASTLALDTQSMHAAHARFSTGEIGLTGCTLWGTALRGGPCLGLSALRSQGHIEGISQPTDAGAWWASGKLSGQLGIVIWRAFELLLEAGAAIPLSARPRFAVDPVGNVAQAAYVSGFARFGLSVRTR